MAVLKISSFGGISPQVPPRYLKDSQAQIALNCPMWNGSLQPLAAPGASVLTLSKTTVPKTIYKYGQDTESETQYWFHWPKDVDVCRSQVAGDASEWTFFTGSGGPKATYDSLALATSDYPTASRPLGLPQPATECTASGNTFVPEAHPAVLRLSPTHVSQITSTSGLKFSLINTPSEDAHYTAVTVTSPVSATSLAENINAAMVDAAGTATATAATVDGAVTITTVATGTDATVLATFQTGTAKNTDGTFTYAANPNLSATGAADTDAWLVIDDAEIGSIGTGHLIGITTESGQAFSVASAVMTAAELAQLINTNAGNKVIAAAYGTNVLVKPGTEGGGATGLIQYDRYVVTTAETVDGNGVTVPEVREVFATFIENGSEDPAPARIVITQATADAAANQYLAFSVNGGEERIVPVAANPTVSGLIGLGAYGGSVVVYGALEPFAVVSTNATGTGTAISLRVGDYPLIPTLAVLTSTGYSDEDETPETRVYTWTWVNHESSFQFESAPAPASATVQVSFGQTVSLSGLLDVPTGYIVTHRRIYRSVNGVFLFVKEVVAANNTFLDDVISEDLGEELPSATYAEPPQDLKGLINLPNGMMAGFVDRDIYFSEPYKPHAWPEHYIQTLDYKVVGLGRMDTTLAVLTKGTPYFIQGSHPASMVVVKSDIEQACVSKRSIVNHGGAVYYASPDGLMMLSPGGSRIVTEKMFGFKQWQELFKPESIHAYQHDNQYIAFYDNGTTKGGFIYDMKSQNVILHDIYAETGYHDLIGDKLFLAYADRTVRVWAAGATKTYRWKSKKFTMPKPMSFAWGQLEAENYPMSVVFTADGTTVHTQTVTSRNPFRLPAKVGRDWEMQIDGDHEVFSLAMAHSSAELRDG